MFELNHPEFGPKARQYGPLIKGTANLRHTCVIDSRLPRCRSVTIYDSAQCYIEYVVWYNRLVHHAKDYPPGAVAVEPAQTDNDRGGELAEALRFKTEVDKYVSGLKTVGIAQLSLKDMDSGRCSFTPICDAAPLPAFQSFTGPSQS